MLHAGAVLDSGVISSITAAGVRTEFSAKVHGGWSLIRRAGPAPLRALNLFSSLAAFSGSGGQGSYAAANAVLDSWANSLQVCTSPVLPAGIAWQWLLLRPVLSSVLDRALYAVLRRTSPNLS